MMQQKPALTAINDAVHDLVVSGLLIACVVAALAILTQGGHS